MYAQLKKRDGTWGAETFVTVKSGEQYESKNGRLVKKSGKLFGGGLFGL